MSEVSGNTEDDEDRGRIELDHFRGTIACFLILDDKVFEE
jgi:hypothetical protein